MKTKEVGAIIAALLLVATTLAISVTSAESMSPFDTANQNAFFDVPYPTNGKIAKRIPCGIFQAQPDIRLGGNVSMERRLSGNA